MIVREHIFMNHMGMLAWFYAYGACVYGCVCVCACMYACWCIVLCYTCSGMTTTVERR